MDFSRQKYWSELPFPFSGDLHNSKIKLMSLALQIDSLLSESPGKPKGKKKKNSKEAPLSMEFSRKGY